MYIKEKKLKIIKIVGITCSVIGVFEVSSSIWVLVSLMSHYSDDLETFLYARATPQAVTSIIIGSVLLMVAYKLKEMVEDANFFSGYFEGDLDGYVAYRDLADVMGKREQYIKKQLQRLQKFCMKNFELQIKGGTEQVVLNSKKYTCECKNCGAPVEKKMYFTGTGAYCGSSDLYAKVLTDNRFYSISNKVTEGIKKPEFYADKNLQMKRVLFIILLSLGCMVMVIMAMYGIDCMSKYGDKEYQRELLLSGESYASFELIQKDLMDGILWGIVFTVALIPVVINRIKRLIYVQAADVCSSFFARCKTPFVKAEELPAVSEGKAAGKEDMKEVRGAIRRRYLRNCTLEKHDDVLMVALAKQIVKDKCPSCNGPIVGAVDENYRCKYCDNIIMDVVRKK